MDCPGLKARRQRRSRHQPCQFWSCPGTLNGFRDYSCAHNSLFDRVSLSLPGELPLMRKLKSPDPNVRRFPTRKGTAAKVFPERGRRRISGALNAFYILCRVGLSRCGSPFRFASQSNISQSGLLGVRRLPGGSDARTRSHLKASTSAS
jgi:hypothetical protein